MKVAKPPRLFLSKTNAVLSIFTFALISTASGQTVTKSSSQESSSVAGVVTDQRGDPVRGATVSLIEPAGENPKPALTDENGSFTIPADAGIFDLQVSAPEFATKTVHGELGGNQQLDLGKLALTIQTAIVEVRVSLTKEELAEEQVKVEEQQRILGVIPNFLVTYDHDPVPLHARQKYELAFRTMIDPETIGMDLVSSGVQQGTGGLKGYGTGSQGYAKRFAASYGTGSIDTMLGSAVLPSLFKQDPRYFYKGSGTISNGRCMPSACQSFAKVITDTGSTTIRAFSVDWRQAASQISTIPRPTGMLSDVTFENTAIGIGSSAVSNLLQEFLIRRFTRKAKQ